MANRKYSRFATYSGTAAKWAETEVILLKGEIGYESDTGLFKFGDGVSAYSALPYANDIPKKLSDLTNDGDGTSKFATLAEVERVLADATGGESASDVLTALNAHKADKLNPHEVTKTQIGLGNVDNTSDANKPVSTATQEALDKKQNKLTFDAAPTAGSANSVTSGGVKAAIDSAKAAVEAEIPDVSSFITKSVGDLANYYLKTEVDATVDELEEKISAIPKFAIQVVETLPASGISATTIYLLKTSTTETGNLYTEYIYVGSAWESLGTQTLDLSGYVTTAALNTALAAYAKTTEVTNAINTALANYVTSATLATELAKKQNALTFDTKPTSGSTNPVTSGGVYSALAGKADADDIVSESTGLSDSDDLMRYSDEIIIIGGEL